MQTDTDHSSRCHAGLDWTLKCSGNNSGRFLEHVNHKLTHKSISGYFDGQTDHKSKSQITKPSFESIYQ